jgi:hypothetical protein
LVVEEELYKILENNVGKKEKKRKLRVHKFSSATTIEIEDTGIFFLVLVFSSKVLTEFFLD